MARTALERLISVRNLQLICDEYRTKAKGSGAGIDGVRPERFYQDIPGQIAQIRDKVRDGYHFSKLRGVAIPKKEANKFRIICVPTLQDRIVQKAILYEIKGRAARLGIANDASFGFVESTPERKQGVGAALDAAVKSRRERPWVFKSDIEAFFDQIDRPKLIKEFSRAFQLKSLTSLIAKAICCEVDDGEPRIRRVLQENGIRRGHGLRQGMPLSPILSNFFLRDFDREFIKKRHHLVRYADDLVVFASSRKECSEIQEIASNELAKLGLKISKQKTAIYEPNEAVEFLGLELIPKNSSSRYQLAMSKEKIGKIREQFTQLNDVDFVVKEGLNLPKLLARLENMKSGYKTAYRRAENYEAFEEQMAQWVDNCLVKIYSSIFSRSSVEKLTENQKKFLLLSSLESAT